MYNENQLKAINIFNFNPSKLELSEKLLHLTNFKEGQQLQAHIYGNMIMILPVTLDTQILKN